MKRLMVVAALTLAGAACGAAETTPRTPEQMEAIRARRHAKFLNRTGGYVIRRDKDAKAFRFVNAQKRVPAAAFAQALATMEDFFRVDFAFADGTFGGKGEKGVVYLVDDPALPCLQIAPEEGWGTLNVAKLGDENVNERAAKELWRAFAFVAGAADTEMPHCLMHPVFGPAELDFAKAKTICPEPIGKMRKHLRLMGIKEYDRQTYQKACEQGWAPAPTNEVQKAIWDKVHQMPTEPIKIKPETKKVSE